MAATTIQSSDSLITTSSSAFTTPSTPTAADAPGATANASDNNGNPNGTNTFSLDDSPPLVVAFLAIGLFVVAIIGVFGWRHFSRFRSPNANGRQGGPNAPNRGRRRKSFTLGKRPALWDLWVDLTGMTVDDDRGRSVEQRTKWEDIAPMTAVVTYLVPHAQPSESTLPIKPESTAVVVVDPARRFRMRAPFGTQWRRRSASAPLRRLFWPDTPSAPPPPPQLAPPHPMSPPPPATPPPPLLIPPSDGEGKVEGAESRTSEEIEWSDALSSVQVTVIIAMPSQRRARQLQQQGTSSTLENDTDSVGTSLGEFCIGTMDVPWSECG